MEFFKMSFYMDSLCAESLYMYVLRKFWKRFCEEAPKTTTDSNLGGAIVLINSVVGLDSAFLDLIPTYTHGLPEGSLHLQKKKKHSATHQL